MGTGTINSKRRYLEKQTKHRALRRNDLAQKYQHNDVEIKIMKAEKLTLKTKINPTGK